MNKIEWYEQRYGATYGQELSPKMLFEQGEDIIKDLNVTAIRGGEKETFKVHYDRDYVIQYIFSTIINPLDGIDSATIHQLIDDAIELAKELKLNPPPRGVKGWAIAEYLIRMQKTHAESQQ